jgi:hypothetical protein
VSWPEISTASPAASHSKTSCFRPDRRRVTATTRQKRLENLRQDFAQDSQSSVGDLDRDITAREAEADVISRPIRRRDVQHAAIGHRVACVKAEVDQREFEFGRIDLDPPEIGRNIGLDCYALREGFAD